MDSQDVNFDFDKIPWYLQPFVAAGFAYANGDIEKILEENKENK